MINVPYSVWKTIQSTNSWSYWYRNTADAENTVIYTGSGDQLFKALAKNVAAENTADDVAVTDWTDWNANLLSGAAGTVEHDEDAALKALEAAPGGLEPPTDPVTGAPVFNISSQQASTVPGKDMRYEHQSSKIDLARSDESHTTVYEVTSASVFYKYAFQVNSDNIYFQVEIDGQDLFGGDGVSLEDLEDLGLGGASGNYGNFGKFL